MARGLSAVEDEGYGANREEGTNRSNSSSSTDKDEDFVRKALKKYQRAYDRERTNIQRAFEDLEFRVGEQWPEEIRRERDTDHRPALTINKIPTYVRQITGDIRLMRPSIRVVPVDSRGDPKTADVLAGLVRYIENRSDARHAYTTAADSQVVAGMGHWRVLTEYADDDTFNQEIRILAVDDGVSVIWDSDAKLPNKEDAKCCFVPVDISHNAFEEKYPGVSVEDFQSESSGRSDVFDEWYGDDFVRIAEYWERKLGKRTLALMPDGSVDDITDEKDKAYIAGLKARGARIEERESYQVYRSVISCQHVLEQPTEWPGAFIPIVPVIGEEVTIGRRVVRHGVVRFLKDPQRAYNYFRSAETETVALQPKAPFIGTQKNFEDNEAAWATANSKNWPYLIYTPDPKNGSIPPQRNSPATNTAAITEGLTISSGEMQEVTGIYDAALGRRSNETSGKAIQSRQRESDVGSYVYAENFSRAIKHTGRILLDLIPHIYDAPRVIRIVGEDSKVDLVEINRGLHDVTVPAYDVMLDQGPSYSTKREEAREGMTAFLQSAPNAAPVVLDLIAEAQDWPNAEKFSKRLKTMLPPQIQAQEAQEAGEQPQPPPPPPAELQMKQAEMQQEMQVEGIKAQASVRVAELGVASKEMDLKLKQLELIHAGGQEQKQDQAVAALAQNIQSLQAQINQIVAVLQGQPAT